MDDKAVKKFVKNTLGCNCPEEVFQYIDCRTAVNIDDNIILDYEINIGNRLLVFVAGIDNYDSLGPVLTKLVQAGITRRDEKKFNRFRLVLLTGRVDGLEMDALKIFHSLVTDEKAHLHVIDKHVFPMNQI